MLPNSQCFASPALSEDKWLVTISKILDQTMPRLRKKTAKSSDSSVDAHGTSPLCSSSSAKQSEMSEDDRQAALHCSGVTRSGFHRMLAEAVGDLNSIEAVLSKFDNEVGSEGRALISSIITTRNADEDE